MDPRIRSENSDSSEGTRDRAPIERPRDPVGPKHQRGDSYVVSTTSRAPSVRPYGDAPLMPIMSNRAIGDGRNEKSRSWRAARTKAFMETYVDPYLAQKAQSDHYLARLAPTNPPPSTDFRGKNVVLGNSVSMTDENGETEVLVPDSADFIPEGRRIDAFELSPDGKLVAYSTAGTGDDRTWRVLDARTRQGVIEPVAFNSFGNGLKFTDDGRGFVYPYHEEHGAKFRPKLMYQSLDHIPLAAEGQNIASLARPPVVAFEGRSVLPYEAQVLTDREMLVVANISVGSSPGFPLFTTILTHKSDGTFASDQSRAFPTGTIGRVVTTVRDQFIVQTAGATGKYGLVRVDSKTGERTDLVAAHPDEVLYVCQRVGDKLLAWFVTEKKYTLRVLDLDGNTEKEIHPADLGMPDWCSPDLGFTGSKESKNYAEFRVSSKLKSTRTYRLDLESLEVTAKLTGTEIDLDPENFKVFHGTFTARDGYEVPYHMWVPKDVPDEQSGRVLVDGYGSIGVVLNRGWNLYHQMLLAHGYTVVEVGNRGGGENGANSRDAGAFDRMKTINDQSDCGYWLASLGYHTRVSDGRSWGGWREENGAVRDPKAFTHRISVVSAGDAKRSIERGPSIWSVHDFGAGMAADGAPEGVDHAIRQANEMSTPEQFERVKELPNMLFVVQDDDDRAEPGNAQRILNILENRFGQRNPRFSMISLPGGHGARAELALVIMWLMGQLGKAAMTLRDQIISKV